MIKLLMGAGFRIQMFPTLGNPDHYFITLKMMHEDIEKEAKIIEFKVKMCNVEIKSVFEIN